MSGAVGFVAGSDDDMVNLSMAAHARLAHPELFLCVRQKSHTTGPLVEAFAPDSVFVPTELVARETLARIITPVYWAFLDHVLHEDDEWSAALLARMVDRVGTRTPKSTRVRLDPRSAPAPCTWLRRHELTDLLTDPDDRELALPALAVGLIRGEVLQFIPDPQTPLRVGDQLILTGRTWYAAMSAMLFQDSAVEYVATGREVPNTWLWRRVGRRHRAHRRRTPPDRGVRPGAAPAW